MIPVKLHLRGFLSYREPVEIDFSPFELACISGQNGAGKSSLLDAITWALFGEARRRDDAVIHSALDTAEVSLEFDYEGNRYRVRRSKTRAKSAVLEFNLLDADGNWKVLTEHTVSETEKRIERTLRMDFETFTNASFFLQGKADQFAQQRPGDRKRILSNILGLEIWETYREGAASRRRISEGELAQVEGQLKEIENELAEEPARRERLDRLVKELQRLGASRRSMEQNYETQVKRAAELEHEKSRLIDFETQLQNGRKRHDQRAQQLAERQHEQASYQSDIEHEAEIELEYKRWQTVRQQLTRLDELAAQFYTLQQQRALFESEIQKSHTLLTAERANLLARKEEIQAAVSRQLELGREVKAEQALLAALEDQLRKRESQKEEMVACREENASLEQENKILSGEREELADRIQRLREAEEETCPLCEKQLDFEERSALVAKLEGQQRECVGRMHQNQDRLKELRIALENITKEINKAATLESQQRQVQKNIADIEARLQMIQTAEQDWQQNDAPRLVELEQILTSEQFAVEARQHLCELDAQLQSLGYDSAVHENLRQQERELSASEARKSSLDKAKSALGPLTREIDNLKLELAEDEREINALDIRVIKCQADYEQKAADLPDLKSLEKDLKNIKTEENQKRMEVGAAQQKVNVLADQKVRYKELTAERSEIHQHISRLRTLERAFGKDGVPALLIEQALPEIESEANTLLDRLSGGTMSVRFATQREYKDRSREDKKETLDIMISDNSNYREYEMFSGGEAFRVNFAIRLALSRVLARRSGARLQTLVIDEGFGSQDADGRQRLIESINLVRKDFAKILVITHLEELKDAFPARIEVEKTAGGSFVRVALA